ncbi:MAG: HAMP domain-containing histidine kinase [Bacteroidales bacterium]|nr:HAMP domain-containing histidine kinase [Bacteroidales bacterium]
MKLIYKITLTFIAPLVVTLALWGWLSYRTMERKIHADTDMILKEYSDAIITRKLSGFELPERFNGAYNTYYIKEVTPEYAAENPAVEYMEAEVSLKTQEDFASSRIRRQIFMDKEGRYYEISVSLPTFEQDTLVEHVLWWTGILFVVLLIALLIIGILVINYNLRPFKALMDWMDGYVPGQVHESVPDNTDVLEFRKLAATVQKAVDRFEHEYAERKIFIGNVSHELQTPLAVCANRVELLLDRPDLDEEMAGELVKLHRSLQHMIRLNKTLLLLAKIENGQFPETVDVDLGAMLDDASLMYDDIYSQRYLNVTFEKEDELVCRMNEQMASVLVNNLLKNAYAHSDYNGDVEIVVNRRGFSVSNSGTAPLDRSKLFTRFYQPEGRKEGATGLGLALAYAVCERNGMELSYDFKENHHVFSVILKKSK